MVDIAIDGWDTEKRYGRDEYLVRFRIFVPNVSTLPLSLKQTRISADGAYTLSGFEGDRKNYSGE
jgi:hypothetical protein